MARRFSYYFNETANGLRRHGLMGFAVVYARLQGQPGVERIVDQSQLLKRVFAVSNILRAGALVAAIVVLLSAAGLIGNTVRMAVFSRRREIGIMRLVGATNWFIRIPFIIE